MKCEPTPTNASRFVVNVSTLIFNAECFAQSLPGAKELAVGTDVFIYIRPMNAVTAGNLPMGALFRRGVRQARIPDKRYGDATSIHQFDGESIVVDHD